MTGSNRYKILPPLKSWMKPTLCRFWKTQTDQHGPLIALRITRKAGHRWNEFDDTARAAAGALQEDRQEGAVWVNLWFSGLYMTKRENLEAIANALEAVGGLAYLKVYELPSGDS